MTGASLLHTEEWQQPFTATVKDCTFVDGIEDWKMVEADGPVARDHIPVSQRGDCYCLNSNVACVSTTGF